MSFEFFFRDFFSIFFFGLITAILKNHYFQGMVSILTFFSQTAQPFELRDVSFCRKQFRLQIHPIEITREWDKRCVMNQKSSKTQVMISTKMTEFWTFLQCFTWTYGSFFTRHISNLNETHLLALNCPGQNTRREV